MQRVELAADFGKADESDWRALVDKALKGAGFDRLRSHTAAGLPIEPIYEGRRDRAPVPGRPAGTRWKVLTRIDHPDPARSNELILDDLQGGADGVCLVLSSSNHTHGAGIAVETLEDLDRLLDGVYLDLIQLRIDAGHEGRSVAAMLVALAEKRGIELSSLDLRLSVDPVGCLARNGFLSSTLERMAPRMHDMVAFAEQSDMKLSGLTADSRIWHNAGADEVQELAYTLSELVAYLRMCEGSGLHPQDRIDTVLAADADQFGTIAKCRALRRLWARVLDVSGLEQHRLHIHAETSWRMMTRTDPWVNMLRATVASFAAGVGGADSMVVLPFSMACGLPDAFARRIARNTQTILLEESNLYRVGDPAAGSGAVEARTDDLVQAAWKLFRETESRGGIKKLYVAGGVLPALAEARQRRMERIATRKDPLTGTTVFPNLEELPVKVMAFEKPELAFSNKTLDLPPPGRGLLFRGLVDAVRDGATLADMALARKLPGQVESASIEEIRLSEPFEALRDAVDMSLVSTEKRPLVLLVALGGPADYSARADWAANLFAAGGLGAPLSAFAAGPDAAPDDAAITAAVRESGASIVCLCSADALYAAHGASTAAAIRAGGAETVLLAGRPGAAEETLRGAGIAGFVHEGRDVLAALRTIHDRLGIPPAERAP